MLVALARVAPAVLATGGIADGRTLARHRDHY
jgi:hypothetical protein